MAPYRVGTTIQLTIAERPSTLGSARVGDVNVEFLSGPDVIANNQDDLNTVMVCDKINKEVGEFTNGSCHLKKNHR